MNYLITPFTVSLLVVFTLSAPAKLSSNQLAFGQGIKVIEFHSSNLHGECSWRIDSNKESPALFKITLLENNFADLNPNCLNSSHIVITDSNNASVAYCTYLKNRELRIFSKFVKIEIISFDKSLEDQYAKFSYEIIDLGTRLMSPVCSHIKEQHHRFWPCKTRFDSDSFSDTVCISSTQICDGIIQCPGSEDEDVEICDALKSTSFKLPPLRDEELIGPVGNEPCPNNAFYCHNDAKCITSANVCDGVQDCLGNMDESPIACDWKKEKSDILNYNATNVDEKSASCNKDYKILCPAENICLPVSVVCNGIIDCSDGYDEAAQACKAIGDLEQHLIEKESSDDISMSTDEIVSKIPHEQEIGESTTNTCEISSSESINYSGSTIKQVENSETTSSNASVTPEEGIPETTEVSTNSMDKGIEASERSYVDIDTTHKPNPDTFTTPTSETLNDYTIATNISVESPITGTREILVETGPRLENASWTTTDDASEGSSSELKAETGTFKNSLKNSNSSTVIPEALAIGAPLEKSNQTMQLLQPISEPEGISLESTSELPNEFPDSTIEPEELNLKKLAIFANDEGEIVFPPLWVARVSSGFIFLCYGILLDLESTFRWVLIPSSCGQYLEPSRMRVHFGAGIDKYEVTARVNQKWDNQTTGSGFSLLQLNSSECVKHFIPQGISLNNSSLTPNNTETICKLLAPRHGYIFSFQVQNVHKEDSITCKQAYEKGDVVSCFSQNLCLQSGLGGILTCPNSILGFYTEGADCYQGQIGWPVMASLITPEITNWIKYIVSMGHTNQCGYSPNEKSQFFQWYTYFNRTQSSEGLCLVAYVRNDTFPLVTSVQCLKQCMNSIPPKSDEEIGCELDKYEADMELCPAKNIIKRLSTPESPWTQCLIAYLPSPTKKEIKFEPVRISAFKDCDGESFYNPFMADTNLCVRAMEDDGVLNCSSWGEAGLVQCKRSSDGLWEFLGFTKSCSARKPRRRWFIRSLEL